MTREQPKLSWRQRLRRRRQWGLVGQIGFAALVLVALVLHSAKDWQVQVDATSLGLLVLLVLVLVGLDRIQELTGPGGVGFKLSSLEANAQAAAATALEFIPEHPPPYLGNRPVAEELLVLAQTLRGHLAETWTYFFDEYSKEHPYGSPDAGYVITRSRVEGLLTRAETALALQILDLADRALRGEELPEAKIWPAMHYTAEALNKVRSTIFDRMVRKACEQAGWQVNDFKQDGKHRPDFLVQRGDTRVIVAARSVKMRESDLLEQTMKRMKRMQAERADLQANASMIVCPPRSESLTKGKELAAEYGLEVVPLNQVEATLRRFESAS